MPITRVEPNFIDKVVTFVSPEAGARRQAARSMLAMSGSYVGARYDRPQTQNWWTSRGSPDADTLIDLHTLRPRSRDLARNAPLALGAINTLVLNAVGTGLVLQPTPDREILGWEDEEARSWAQAVGHEFAMWADSQDCDITRTSNFYEAQALAFRSKLESGDTFAILPMAKVGSSIYSTKFQLIEADRIANPSGGADGMDAYYPDQKAPDGTPLKTGNKIYAGVEKNDAGAPVAYWVLRVHPGAIGWTSNTTIADRIPAYGAKTGRRNVLHVFDRFRPDQTRGVPYLAPVIESLKQLDRYTEAEIMAAVVTSMFTVFVKSDTGDVGIGGPVTPAPIQQNDLELGPGKILGLAPGEDVSFPPAPRPNSGFDPFVTSILRQIGVALEIPFEILVKHFTSSYSAARAAMLEAWKFYRNRRNFLSVRFCQPIYEAWMDEAVAIGRVKAPGYFADPLLRRAYLSADWIGDAPGAIDPLKEGQAAKLRVDEGFSNLQIETMELTGRNWNDLHPQRAREHQLRVAAGLEPPILNATAQEPVNPMDPDADGDDDTNDPQDKNDPKEPPTPEPAPVTPTKSKTARPPRRGGGR